MGNKQMLFDLINKYRDILLNSHDYVLCNQVLAKIGESILTCNSDKIELDLSEISKLKDDEVEMFTSPDCARIVVSLGIISGKKGWRVDTVLKLIKQLQQDILENKMNKFSKEKDSLDELYRIIEEGTFLDNYNLILDFIKMSVDNGILSMKDATRLNFYVLKECSVSRAIKEQQDVETIELTENVESVEQIRKRLVEVFSKYGYEYDSDKMGDLDDKFVRYADIIYVDYVLSQFKKYNINSSVLYLRKRSLCNIIIDNDRETFDLILKFIDENSCSLKSLLAIPAVFSRKKKDYVEKTENGDGRKGEASFTIYGAQQDFLDNVELYKKCSGLSVISDSELEGLSKFLCTPSSLVKKNFLLLERYGVVSKGKLPKAILALCGNFTEYLIDRYIEIGLYNLYLLPRVNNDGQIKEPRGTSYLDRDNNPFRFYKLKRAKDLGQDVFASNAGVRRVFHDDNENYMGISLVTDLDGKYKIEQAPLTLEFMRSLKPEIRRQLPEGIKHKINIGEINEDDIGLIYFDNLYKYRVISPVEIFNSSDKVSLTSLKGDRINSVFAKDYKRVLSDEEIKNLELDSYIALLDNAVYCDSLGDSSRVKVDNLRYEFFHPSIPNVVVVVSRYKVLRLCKLLKEDGSWISNSSSITDKENTLLSVILKDMIVSDIELLVLRLAIKDILTNGLIRVSEIKNNGRGAR